MALKRLTAADYVKEAIKLIKEQVLYDKGIWSWCAIFSGLYVGSRLFFYKFYYPSLLRTFSPPSFFQSDKNETAKRRKSRQSSISNAFPQILLRRESIEPLHSESLYSKNIRFKNSKMASGKLMSLTHAILTVYKGLNIMSTLGITQYAVSEGVDYIQPPIKTDNPLILDMVNMNTSYALIDLLIIYLPNPRNNIAFIIHHGMVVIAGILLKYFNEGSPIWLISYCYSDIPTIILHSLWFFRNIGTNLKSLFALFSKQSVKESQYLNGYRDIDEEINANINILSKIEKFLFLGFSASFLYIRCVAFTRIIPFWLWNSLKSNNWSKQTKVVATGCIAILMGVGYWWSYKLVLKIQQILTNNDDDDDDNNNDDNKSVAILPIHQHNKRAARLPSVDEQQAVQ